MWILCFYKFPGTKHIHEVGLVIILCYSLSFQMNQIVKLENHFALQSQHDSRAKRAESAMREKELEEKHSENERQTAIDAKQRSEIDPLKCSIDQLRQLERDLSKYLQSCLHSTGRDRSSTMSVSVLGGGAGDLRSARAQCEVDVAQMKERMTNVEQELTANTKEADQLNKETAALSQSKSEHVLKERILTDQVSYCFLLLSIPVMITRIFS